MGLQSEGTGQSIRASNLGRNTFRTLDGERMWPNKKMTDVMETVFSSLPTRHMDTGT